MRILFSILFFCLSILSEASVIRAAIDIGSGGPKLRIAEVDLAANKIVQVLFVKQYPLIFYESLALSPDKSLSPEIMEQGLLALQDAIAIAKSHEAQGTVLIGASIFRAASNATQYIDAIHAATGLKVHVLDQDLESKLGFQAALANKNVQPDDLIVWDVGGGSTQLITTHGGTSHFIHGSNEGSGPFRDFIISSIQDKNLKECRTPNPISADQALLAQAHASTFSHKIDHTLRSKIHRAKVVGVGSVFSRGILRLVQKNPFTMEELSAATSTLIGKTDADLGGGDFACIEVSNALLVLGYMKGLGIKQMSILDVNNADGALFYEPFWGE